MRPGLRRRRKIHRSTAMAGDPLDLFQHAMTNARGVIMFVMLMMALFGQASDAVVQVTVNALETVEKLRALSEERDDLQRKLAAAPPKGDPELAARYLAAMEQLRKLQPEVDHSSADIRREEAELARLRALTEAANRDRDAARADVPKNASPRPTSFVRVSRFQEDKRKSVIVAVADGKVSRIRATSTTETISAPSTGTAVLDADTARAAVADLLGAYPSATHRVELLVWQGSFRQAKLVEQALLEAGYDSNPIPLVTGQALAPGAGGVQ
jgi:hypothetical protein